MLKPTSSKNFSFLFRRDGIYVVDDKKNRTRIADPIKSHGLCDQRSSLQPGGGVYGDQNSGDRQGRRKVSIR